MKYLTRIAVAAGALSILAGAPLAVQAEGQADCLVSISRTELGFIIEVGGGKGVLNCQGQRHPFRVGGIQVGGMGMGGSKAHGEVFNLKTIHDFPGTYTGGEAQITTVAGVGKMDLTNEHGVRMVLTMETSGANAKLGAKGLTVAFE